MEHLIENNMLDGWNLGGVKNRLNTIDLQIKNNMSQTDAAWCCVGWVDVLNPLCFAHCPPVDFLLVHPAAVQFSPYPKYLVNANNAIFLKSSKDIKYDVPICQIHKYSL